MLKFKNFKQKFLQSPEEKSRLTRNRSKSSSTLAHHVILNENQVTRLTQWLEQLNRQQLITITEQNDIVIMTGGENDETEQIFINSDDVGAYMKAKMGRSNAMDEDELIHISDIARILLKCGYVDGSSGQLLFHTETITLDSNELTWLISIVRGARVDLQSRETHVTLFDGENTQLLCIPYEHMALTNDTRAVATYLFQNGHVRYDIDTGTYAYRYVEPDVLLNEKTKSPVRVDQRQFLSFHIRQVHVDQQNERVELEFLYDPAYRLVLPTRWYRKLLDHGFDRNYIIDILLGNGGVINRDTFVFMGRAYSLKVPPVTSATSYLASSTNLKTVNLSSKQKNDLIRRYIDLIIEQDGTKQDDINRLVILENAVDGRQLYFTPEHSQLIRQNQFQRQDVVHLLVKHGQIKQDESGNLLLYYSNQYIQFPPSFIPSTTASPS
jgi:hypothetical protein